MSGPIRSSVHQLQLEEELQTELDRSVAPRAKHRIESCLVWRGTAATESTSRGRIGVCALPITAGRAVRICIVGVIENVKRLKTELRFGALTQIEILADGEVNVAEAGVAKNIAAQRTELSDAIRDQD